MNCEKKEFPDIEEVFPGMSKIEQGIQLAILLLKYEDPIKEQLNKDGCYEAFCERVSHWRDEYLKGGAWSSPRMGEEATMMLYSICCEFGVTQFLMCEITRVRECVRSRGVRGSLQILRQQLEEVARLFSEA